MLSRAYAQAIETVGGLPLLLPFDLSLDRIPAILDLFDGFLLTGGDDPDPALWGEPWHPKVTPLDPARQSFELALLAALDAASKPTLGICLGMQLMNLHRGGSLIQYLPEHPRENAIEHRRLDQPMRRHEVSIAPDSRLARINAGAALSVNTQHKQAAGRVGRGLVASALAPDGVVEAIEDPSREMFLGVQWHPERLIDEPAHRALFEQFLSCCRGVC
jgi:putative glutamine amidotransferase